MKKPVINKVMFIYLLLSGVLIFIFCLWSIKDAFFPSDLVLQKHPDPGDSFYLFNKVVAIIWAFFGFLHLWLVRKIKLTQGSKPLWRGVMWLNLIYTLMIPLNLLFLTNLFLLLFWCGGKNKEYHFERGNEGSQEAPTGNPID